MSDLLVNIDVDDLSKAEAFYSQAFGLKAGRRFGDGGVEMLGLAAPIYLLVKAKGTKAASATDQVRDYGRHWTPVHIDIVVDDIDVHWREQKLPVRRSKRPSNQPIGESSR
jgi:predicted enzyme related to lactoylglutathione lyase